jgi:hypothetical protein
MFHDGITWRHARPVAPFLLAAVALAIAGLRADEGMWTFDRPPIEAVKKQYGFTISPEWLEHLRLASVRFNDGGSGSFVSPDGLVLTNHHVALGQLQKISTPQKNYAADGFFAASRAEEIKVADLELNVLMSSEEVTGQVVEAARNAKTAQAALDARNATIARLEKESLDRTGLRSDVVSLYQGAEYWLYRYKQYTDVRLVFAPEQQMAFFGGDPDNFTYPRYDFDFALFRVYERDRPVRPQHFLKWNARGAADQELVFVSGHPGATDRNATVAELETARELDLPTSLRVVKRRIGVLKQYAARGPEQGRQASELTFELENALKANTGEYEGLLDQKVMAKKTAEERALRDAVSKRPDWRTPYGGAWGDVQRVEIARRRMYKAQRFEQIRGSSAARLGLVIVQYVSETQKPDGARLPGFHDAQLPSLKFQLLSPAPIYMDLEAALFADALQESLEELGRDDPFIKIALGDRSPAEAAHALLSGTQLADPAVRKELIDGGAPAVSRSSDPLIVLGRALEPLARRRHEAMEREVVSVETPAHEKIGRARFAVYGASAYPDATFTLRLSYGLVNGYPMNGTRAPYKTTISGVYDRSAGFDGKPPFNLTPRFIERRPRLDLSTPLDFVTTNDIIGGNSGSPVVNRAGELVGLIFDGNIESLVGQYVYDGEKNRAVAVHSGAIIYTLRAIYDAGTLADELDPSTRPNR